MTEKIDVEVEDQDKEPTSATTPAAEPKTTDKDISIPKARFDQVNTEKNDLRKKLKALEVKQEKAEATALEEQGKYKELYEKAQADAETAAGALATLSANAMKQTVATEAGYPALWERISGDDEEALKADMVTLIAAIPAVKAPPIDGGTGSGSRSKEPASEWSEAEVKQMATTLGVPYEHFKKELLTIK